MAQMLALFKNDQSAANATEALEQAGYTNENWDILTGSPYPEGAFGERVVKHRLYVFPFMGAIMGFSLAVMWTVWTQAAFPLVTGGKPILSLPPMIIIGYEWTLLGAIIFTILGILFESRIPNFQAGLYDPRITEGYIGITIEVAQERINAVEQTFRRAGADDVLTKE